MDKLVNRNSALTEKQKQLEEELKQEITQEYDLLMKQADQREQVALERINQSRQVLQEMQQQPQPPQQQNDNKIIEQQQVDLILIDNNDSNKEPPKEEEEEEKEPIITTISKQQKVNNETTEKEYKPSIRIIQSKVNSPMTTTTTTTNIKLIENRHHSIETSNESIDNELKKRIELFKSKNIHGHASNSKIFKDLTENNLNNDDENQLEIDAKIRLQKFAKFTNQENRIESIDFESIIQPYKTDFNFQNSIINNSLLGKEMMIVNELDNRLLNDNLIENESSSLNSGVELLFSYNYINIEEILNRLLYKPIQLQNELVNKCLMNHFFLELKLEQHLIALRQYMLFESSEFAHTFISELCDKIIFTSYSFNNLNKNLLNPIYVNEALDKAISSVNKNCKYVERFSIRIDFNKEKARQNVAKHDSDYNNDNDDFSNFSVNYQKQILIFLSCLELKYKLEWPLNLIITDKCMRNYNLLFEFLLQIKLVLVALNNIWNALKSFGKYIYFII
jgi:gamma-tubulin complex component 6